MNDTPKSTRNARKHTNRKMRRDEDLRQKLPRLEQWIFLERFNEFILQGNVYNSPGFLEGVTVSTSKVVKMNHIVARTISGSEYLLGTPHPDYIKFREQNNLGPITYKVFRF